jgi:phage terminase large subunit GpA-like protein
VGANSPRGFRRRTARVVVLEEVDGYPPSAGTEGDQIKLAERRADTFQHRAKVYINSTPTLKGFSRIEDQFVRSDQRRYFVACPDCGHEQTLVWQNLKWDDGRPDTAAYACAGCGVLIPEREKFGMVAGGHWVKTAPEWSTAGFHINALYSPWVAWRKLAEEWIDAQGDLAKLQVFVNTALGETWEDRGGGLDPRVLESRREAYGAEVPNQVGLLTCGVDVQHDRLEYIVRGWGHAEESWLIAHGVVLGDTGKPDVWADFERERAREYRNAAGNALQIAVTCVDTGDGNNVDAAYRYCKPRYGLRVYATKGSSRPGAPLLPRRPTTNNKGKVRLFLIGTDTAKDEIYSRLKLSIPGPRYMHVPDWISDDYFAQVTSEKVVRENVNGRWVKRYKLPPKARNEALDCEVLAFAAMRLAPWKPAQFAGLAARAATPQAPQEPAPAESPEEPVQTLEQVVQASRPPRGRRRSGYIDGWRR